MGKLSIWPISTDVNTARGMAVWRQSLKNNKGEMPGDRATSGNNQKKSHLCRIIEKVGKQTGTESPKAKACLLRCFNQLHLALARPVQHHHFSLRIAEDKDIAVAKVCFFDSFFKSHGAQRHGL
jgi:hypothetical protein